MALSSSLDSRAVHSGSLPLATTDSRHDRFIASRSVRIRFRMPRRSLPSFAPTAGHCGSTSEIREFVTPHTGSGRYFPHLFRYTVKSISSSLPALLSISAQVVSGKQSTPTISIAILARNILLPIPAVAVIRVSFNTSRIRNMAKS